MCDRVLLQNPYESPASVNASRPPLIAKLLPTLGQEGFAVLLTALSMFVQLFHHDAFDRLGISTVTLVVIASRLLAFVGCAFSSALQRTERFASTVAFLGGVAYSAVVAPCICWIHIAWWLTAKRADCIR